MNDGYRYAPPILQGDIMIVTPLLQLAADKQASDLFFSVGAPVNIKIDGIAMPVNAQILDAEIIRRIAYEMMTPKRIAEFEAKMEMNFSFRADGIGNFRVNIFRQRNDVAIVIRHVKGKIDNVENLNLPAVLKDLIMEKPTTLAAMIEHRKNTKSGHILTIEDPIEYIFGHGRSMVNQREIGTDTLT